MTSFKAILSVSMYYSCNSFYLSVDFEGISVLLEMTLSKQCYGSMTQIIYHEEI